MAKGRSAIMLSLHTFALLMCVALSLQGSQAIPESINSPGRHLREFYIPALVSSSGTTLPEPGLAVSKSTPQQLVKDIAIDNAVIVTWANNHYYDFAKNFAAHMRDLGITNFLIGAMDKQLLQRLEADGVPTWLMGSKGMDERTVQRDFGWGTHNFHKMGRDKIRLIRDFTRLGIDVLISDIDVAWIANPLPFFRRHPEADILVSTDQLRNESVGDGLEFHICQTASNIGIMWFRSTPGAQAMTQEWVDVIEKDPRKWDQVAFNDLKALGGACQGKRDPKTGLMPAYNNKVKMGILPIALFSNGHTFYVQRLQDRLPPGIEPFAVHATFQYSGTPGKRHRMREAGVWLGDDDSYFQGKFMTYTPRIPPDMDMDMFRKLGWPSRDGDHKTLEPNSKILGEHLRMVNFQLYQVCLQ
ncbi:hypothetical protein CYMTET_42340 [Cymbomonas tetramitiformis]|uniref:Nucleotide-diphospho-sugar transferase domain-containing protein n=1 Tax=Cymbomonas tetramitiformis TaxID=36881 RepID=A0AAE0C4C1_9CHLO|nr:hypothetical protein CYMTET_42340 [Cymbomonas tetramitiformis]